MVLFASPLVLAVTVVAFAPLQQEGFDKVEVVSTKVTDGVYMLTGRGGNIGVSVGPDGVFLIDDQYAPLTDKIRAAVKTLSDGPIRFVLNTHWHGDHTGGNENFGASDVVIVAHENVRKRMSVEQFIEAFGSKVPASPKAALPVVTFTDAVTFHLNGDDIRSFHVAPAHTDGDAVVQFAKANVVHMGDCFFNGMYPFIDLSSGGSLEGMIAAADTVLGRVDAGAKIIPGHGPLADKAALQSYRDMLVGVRDRVKPLVMAGKTLEEVKAAQPTKAFDEKWGQGFMKAEVFLGIVYKSLKGK
jgi:glyoxylase-like metal-dependent hydrolase (beta-lactamase superfamily II)